MDVIGFPQCMFCLLGVGADVKVKSLLRKRLHYAVSVK